MRRIPRNFSPHKQKGAAAIEFALVFVVFFAVFYGLVTYSLPLLMMQSFNNAAAEAVRQSVAISPSAANYQTQVLNQAKAALSTQLSWIPSFNVASDTTVSFDGKLLQVLINYPKTKLTQILPVLTLPGIGDVPNLPTYLSAEASLQLAP
ncbi:TadE/TadG family type IV pilus assembly protein [Pseudomonas abietaniphila]|uniref:TadE-like protein n=1 Tax=Pseudomonas abietaniphila TaxID=89065 RepID=A0A1G7XNT8_9PSED|nr:TadE/TadG family type IV pilus assembly protein [Pseudomonas abietaniphila]SDG85842.1 TadE-like protein [Pseudomonas abietaniphila]